jgi:hypothetical protein
LFPPPPVELVVAVLPLALWVMVVLLSCFSFRFGRKTLLKKSKVG